MYRAFTGSFVCAALVLVFADVSSAQDWDGGYIGAHAGIRWSDFDVSTPVYSFQDANGVTLNVPASRRSYRFQDAIGGVHGGYNLLLGGGWLIGLEGDYSWGRDGANFADVFQGSRTETSRKTIFVTRTITEIVPIEHGDEYSEEEVEFETITRTIRIPRTVTTTRTINSRAKGNSDLDLESQGTLRLRFGLTQANFLYYVTAGVAFTDVDWSNSISIRGGASATVSKSDTLVGFVVGTGAETFIAPQALLRLEYLYEDFGRMNVPLAFTGKSGELDVTVHKLRLGVSYKF